MIQARIKGDNRLINRIRCLPPKRHLLASVGFACLLLLDGGQVAHASLLGNLMAPFSGPDVVPMPPNADQLDPRLVATDCKYAHPHQWLLCQQIYAAQMPPIDPQRRQWFGQDYSPTKYLECRKKSRSASCERYRLVRNPHPEYWPYPDVPPVKWPEAPNPPTWQSGMSGKEYFQALCEREAGWFIYRTVEDVEGLYIVRPRGEEDSDYHLADPYVVEDPWAMTILGWLGAYDKTPDAFIQPSVGPYLFVETKRRYLIRPEHWRPDEKPIDGPDYYRFFRNPNRNSGLTEPVFWKSKSGEVGQSGRVPYIVDRQSIPQVTARYGFTWREIERPQMSEKGIVGGELIVLDLKTNEVLGVRRVFMTNSGSYLRGGACQKPGKTDNAFIRNVLKPKQINN